MSTFDVKVRRLGMVMDHPHADKLSLAKVDGYHVIFQKDRFATGDLVVYVPEAAVVPDWLLRKGFWKECEDCGDGDTRVVGMVAGTSETPCSACRGRGGTGMLAGKLGNRVKAVKLRKVVSQGILFDLDVLGDMADLPEGHDVADILGIEKYQPPIPANLAGKVYACGTIPPYTNMDNILKWPDILEDGEEVVFTEKLHGTCLVAHFDGERVHVSSKGFAGKMLAIEDEKDEWGRSTNFYWRALQAVGGIEKLDGLSAAHGGQPVTLYGEGLPAQDLAYGLTGDKPTMRAFDLKVGGQYVDYDDFLKAMDFFKIPTAPSLFRGPFSQEALDEHTTGPTTLEADHIREGVVVKPVKERQHDEVGRVMFKSISEKYLFRRGGTEFE